MTLPEARLECANGAWIQVEASELNAEFSSAAKIRQPINQITAARADVEKTEGFTGSPAGLFEEVFFEGGQGAAQPEINPRKLPKRNGDFFRIRIRIVEVFIDALAAREIGKERSLGQTISIEADSTVSPGPKADAKSLPRWPPRMMWSRTNMTVAELIFPKSRSVS